MVKKYLKTGVGLIGTGIVIGSIPNVSGTATETTLKTNVLTGLGNVGTALPVMGKVAGAGMVLKSVDSLKKTKLYKKYKGYKI